MRARNIKPSLFRNELLAIADPLYTVVFAGLWCLADRRGRLEDRPAKIHFDINPGRAYEGTSGALIWLCDNGFIRRYEVNGTRYVQILSFEKHQNPHHKEPESVIPAMSGANGPCIEAKPEASDPCLTHAKGENPSDSGFLIPDSGFLIAQASGGDCSPVTEPKEARGTPTAKQVDTCALEFEEIRKAFPRRAGSQRWADALGAYRARKREGCTFEEVMAGVRRYADFVEAQGNAGTAFVQQAATFFGTNRGFQEEWAAETKANGRHKDPYANAI